MTKSDIEKIIESKREYRKELASRPVPEKLRMLDELHRRARTLSASTPITREESDRRK